ncbi:MAG TPA: hypothetical protein VMZ27_05140 [Candidatus Saccharimonadales bacterium]|nr:hypothetical protein [Candidatus Saccharimonadales bacterium]
MHLAKHDRDFIRVVEFATALSLALMTGFIFAIKRVNPSIEFSITVGTVLAFILSGFTAWVACHLFFKKMMNREEVGTALATKRKALVLRWVIFFCGALVVETVLAFAFGLRGVPSEKLREVIEGTLWAIFFLSIVGCLFWKLTRFVESDSPPAHLRDRESNHD